MNLIKIAKRLFTYKPNVTELARFELEDSQRQALECQRMRDYYDSLLSFYKTRIDRLNDMEIH